VTGELEALAARIDRLARQPRALGAPPVSVLTRILGVLIRRPRLATTRLRELVERIENGPSLTPVPVEDMWRRALEELDENVRRAEWYLAARGHLPDGWAGWLWRMGRALRLAREWALRPARRDVLRPLVAETGDRAVTGLAVPSQRASRLACAVDPLIDAAFAEPRLLGRQRALLEAARRLLLQARAEGVVDEEAAAARARVLARRIARLDRLEAAGLRPDVDLAYQAGEARGRGELQRLHAALVALEEGAAAAGDDTLAGLAEDALERLWHGGARLTDVAARRSLAESCRQIFSDDVRSAVSRAYEAAPGRLARLIKKRRDEEPGDYALEADFFRRWGQYLSDGAADATLSAALAVGGCFELGVAASPGRAAPGVRAALVRAPTERLQLEAAEGLDDLPHALITDPRTLVPDLATGRLLARRYVGDRAAPEASGRALAGEARIYVVDGSSSMLGPRARMRDALLVAELATLANRWRDAERLTNPVLFYRYFTHEVGPTRRVGTPEEALAAIDDVLSGLRFGGTDIQGALLASFEQARQAKVADPELARAHIVLVTDGDAAVDEKELQAARESAGDLPIGVSIVALGIENQALRRLAAQQRARGEHVFYQFMDDAELAAVAEGRTAGLPIHLPDPIGAARLGGDVASLVAEIERHGRTVDVAGLERERAMGASLAEVGLAADTELAPGDRARRAALERDRLTLEAAFGRAFPDAAPAEGDAAAVASVDELDGVLTSLATVAEVVGTFGADALDRQADAIGILHRLLADAGVPPWRYEAIVAAPPAEIAAALRDVRAAARVADPSR
jgi:hypothetical protein